MKIQKQILLYTLFLFIFGCSDNRPDAEGAAHIYNSTDSVATVLVKPDGGVGVEFTVAPGKGEFVPLKKADTYTVTVTSPASLSSYSQSLLVSAGDTTDTVFDLGSRSAFALVPTYHVPRDMPEYQAHEKVAQVKEIGKHKEYLLANPAAKHTLPRGVYYSFKDEVEEISRLTDPGNSIEIRYKFQATYR